MIVQEEQSGSGTFDLRMVHGLSDARHYTNAHGLDLPGEGLSNRLFRRVRVRRSADGTIVVSREKTTVNVISLKAIDAELNNQTKVRVFDGDKMLCDDIGKGCIAGIFYERG